MTHDSDMNFSARGWVELLSTKHRPSRERVIITGNLARTFKIRKKEWDCYFAKFDGIDFKGDKEIELIAGDTGGPRVEIPQWIRERLNSSRGSKICVTERRGKYYLKKLDLVEKTTEIPGLMIIDTFKPDIVKREYASSVDFEKISSAHLERLLSLMGRFQTNPLAPFKTMKGRVGILARREFLGGPTKEERMAVRDYNRHLTEKQRDNGSWDDNNMTTAFNLMRLVEAGVTVKDPVVEKGVRWLLSTTEPLGFPGLFMLSEKHVCRFNAWKERQGGSKTVRSSARNTTPAEARKYLQDRDVLSSLSHMPCELRLTWTSGIVIEALLRCGLHEHPRVIRAINTLFTMSENGGWCGCGYFDTRKKNYIPESVNPVDFNRFPAFKLNPQHISDLVVSVVCNDRGRMAMNIGENQALMVRSYWSTGECGMVVRRALSFHPAFRRSNFEANTALICMLYQSGVGEWGSEYLSSMFGMLDKLAYPLSAFLVLRSVPLLIREQRSDGFWHENLKGNCPPPKPEESTFIILNTLKKFNYLDALLPKRVKHRH